MFPPLTRNDTIGNYIEIATTNLVEFQLSFTADSIEQCEVISDVKSAAILAMKARDEVEDLLIGKLSKLKDLIKKDTSTILEDISKFSKNEKAMQLMKMLESDNDPLIVMDQEGTLGALTIIDGEIANAVKPNWLKAITVYRNSRTLKYGDESRNEGIDRNAYRRKSRFENQARRDENNYSKAKFYGKRKMDQN